MFQNRSNQKKFSTFFKLYKHTQAREIRSAAHPSLLWTQRRVTSTLWRSGARWRDTSTRRAPTRRGLSGMTIWIKWPKSSGSRRGSWESSCGWTALRWGEKEKKRRWMCSSLASCRSTKAVEVNRGKRLKLLCFKA